MYSVLANARAITPGGVWKAFTPVERAVLIGGSLLCGFVCIGTGQLLGIPHEPGFNGSLLAAGSPLTAIIVVTIAVAICTAIGSFISAVIDIESGLFCCCMGLAAWSIRCGAIRPVLQYANGPSVFVMMAIETVLLAIFICGVWFTLRKFFDRPEVQQTSGLLSAAANEITDATLKQKLMVLGVQVVVMGVCELILIQSDAKAQAMAGVCVSAFLGVLAAYMFMPLPEGIWYWSGPVVVGIVGYLLAYFNDGSVTTGDVHGWAGPLARATPLDYAGMGTAGALLAYWCGRRWAQPEEGEPETAVAGQ